MRLGGAIVDIWDSPEEWAGLALEMGYRAVFFPLDYHASDADIEAFRAAAEAHDLVIAEVGIWNNLLERDPAKQRANQERAVRQLELADHVGARCCVNISGSRSGQWDGPHPENLTPETFAEVVRITQEIIDAARPTRTFYTLEPMPWMFPHTADSYLELLAAVDRERFGCHLDFVNVINSLEKYYRNGELIDEWFRKLGPHIRSCHAKDIRLGTGLTLHLDECRPGTGQLDYPTLIRNLRTLGDDACLMLEHMSEREDYVAGMRFLNSLLQS
ncbi:MAG: sugar phosphate isomerase/epimerase [Bacillota bacterium]|nr:sugar phosphate isomerase/epimerase [Bacillota bacterium]